MSFKDTFFSKKQTINFGGTLIEIDSPLVMGIVNITPDSFYAPSRTTSNDAILQHCEAMIAEGASILDIGGYSSRPGAENISEEEEIMRLTPALSVIRKHFSDVIISIDTFRPGVVERMAVEFGIQMVNDISGGDMDGQMFEVVAKHNLPYVLMHIKGTPQTMQQNTYYTNLVKDILTYFAVKADAAKKAGINDVIIDPGFGFGKTLEQNFELLNRLAEFRILELPILAGISRKSMIYKTTGSDAENALAGTIAANTLALLNGADILRVHDVKEAMDAIKIVDSYKKVIFEQSSK